MGPGWPTELVSGTDASNWKAGQALVLVCSKPQSPDGAAGLLLANTRHYDLAPAPRLLHGDANGLGILGAGGRGGGERVSRRYVGPGLETELVAWL